jgi:hypothetical protein
VTAARHMIAIKAEGMIPLDGRYALCGRPASWLLRSLTGLSLLVSVALAQGGASPIEAVPAAGGSTAMRFALPSGWIENAGQWQPSIRHATFIGGTAVQLERGALRLLVPREDKDGRRSVEASRLTLGNPVAGREPQAMRRRDEVYHFFVGRDENSWKRSVPAHDSVVYPDVSAGVDVHVSRDARGLELRFLCERGADLDAVTLQLDTPGSVRRASQSLLAAGQPGGSPALSFRECWEQDPDGGRRTLSGSLRPEGERGFGLVVPGRLPENPLIVSVALEWSTLLGGSAVESVEALVLDEQGGTIVGGFTGSFDFPVTEGALDTDYGGGSGTVPKDLFVARFSPSGGLLWATFLGGNNNETVARMLLADDGSIVVGGDTGSMDFPTTPGSYAPGPPVLGAGFLTALSASGDALVFSTFLGGNGLDVVNDLAVDASGSFILVGFTSSTDFPTTPNAIQTTGGGFPPPAFISRLSPDASTLTYSTYLGGGGTNARAVCVGPEGEILAAGGSTDPSSFPTTPGAYLPTSATTDAFVVSIDPVSGQLLASTFLGIGNSGLVKGVGVDGHGRVVVAGFTGGLGPFPMGAPSLDNSFNGTVDTYVAKLDLRLTTLLYGTFIGGFGDEKPYALVVERSGAVVVAGSDEAGAGAGTFPTTPGALKTESIGGDAIVLRLSPDGTRLDYSTFLGGLKLDEIEGRALAVGPLGAVTVGGDTRSTDFLLTPGAVDTRITGFNEAFVARLSLLPDGAARYGAPTPLQHRLPAIGVSSMPQVGADDFSITCSEAPPSGLGLLFVSAGPSDPQGNPGDIGVWVDADALLTTIPVHADTVGYVEVPLRLPQSSTPGVQVFFQFLWQAPGQSPQLGASNALALTLQP